MHCIHPVCIFNSYWVDLTTVIPSISHSFLIFLFQESNKILVAFDFDHTIIDDNSDLYVRKLAPQGKIPQHIRELYSNNGWTEYMASIFEFLFQNGTTPEQILSCMTEIDFTEGMPQLLKFLGENEHFDIIIISDSNSVFISHIMKHAGYDHYVDETYTNPAKFSDAGCLTLEYYHHQDWCQLSTKNLCKGHILLDHIQKQKSLGVNYSTVAYVGDGSNDLCPGLKLNTGDILFARTGFSLMKKIAKGEYQVDARVVSWESGVDILKELQKLES